jgi:sterol desaturase/sphingolipid hydroxylase (fatty acid hydroxylase superfamily)
MMLMAIAMFCLGLAAWSLLEYAVHGWLGHVFPTFVAPIHDVHHRDPAAVFAIGVWVPLMLLWIVTLVSLGWHPGAVFISGIVVGFAFYEVIHYRIHFSRPLSKLESTLRARHLYHHLINPNSCFGVTSPLWDIIFGTDDTAARNIEMFDRVEPLTGISNLVTMFNRLKILFRFAGSLKARQ